METTGDGRRTDVLMIDDFTGERAVALLPDAVYHRLAPVPASLHGTTLSSAVIELVTVEGMTDVRSADMGAVARIERVRDGSAVGLADRLQPNAGLKKRNGVTRGKPPREHLTGLPKPGRTS